MAFGASVDVLGGVVVRAAPHVASLPPECARAGVCMGVLNGVMARAMPLDIHGCMHMGGCCPTARRTWVPHAEVLSNDQSKHELDITRQQVATEVNKLRAQLYAVLWAIHIFAWAKAKNVHSEWRMLIGKVYMLVAKTTAYTTPQYIENGIG